MYLGNGDGTLQSPISSSLGNIGIPGALFYVIAAGDFNKDGHLDAIATTGPAGSFRGGSSIGKLSLQMD